MDFNEHERAINAAAKRLAQDSAACTARIQELDGEDEDDLSDDQALELECLRDACLMRQEASRPRPTCCEAARTHEAVVCCIGDDSDGAWVAATHSSFDAMTAHGQPPPAAYCTFCGARLPELVYDPTRVVVQWVNGHCKRCDERVESCYCDPPEAAFVTVPR